MSSLINSNIVHEGWLTKSPPTKRVFKLKWRRRWFVLKQSKELPRQYSLDYYADKSRQKLKGTINLDLCEQVDSGLTLPCKNNEDTSSKGSIFSIQTKSRVYHLQADCVSDMEKWVEIICKFCNFRSTDDTKHFPHAENIDDKSKENSSGPYIPISECFTGFPIGYKGDLHSMRNGNRYLHGPSHLRLSGMYGCNTYVNLDQKDPDPRVFLCHSMNNGYKYPHDNSDLRLSTVYDPCRNYINLDQRENVLSTKFSSSLTFGTRKGEFPRGAMPVRRHSLTDASCTPPIAPPRPPKSSHPSKEVMHKEQFIGPRICEPAETSIAISHVRYRSDNSDVSLPDYHYSNTMVASGSNSEHKHGEYYVFPPPAVNRDLKPGRRQEKKRNVRMHYLDLDFSSKVDSSAKPRLPSEPSTVYKKVDFVKTEALSQIYCLRSTQQI